MSVPPLVPPLKCQGIKTKLVGEIRRIAEGQSFEQVGRAFLRVVRGGAERATGAGAAVRLERAYHPAVPGHPGWAGNAGHGAGVSHAGG